MVRGTNTSTPGGPHAATDVDMFLVHMERSHVSSTWHNNSIAGEARRLNPLRRRCQMSNIATQSLVDDEHEDRIRDGGIVTQIESARTRGQSALCTSHPSQVDVHPSLCLAYGVYNTTKQQ
jgi:hypothetical protein